MNREIEGRVWALAESAGLDDQERAELCDIVEDACEQTAAKAKLLKAAASMSAAEDGLLVYGEWRIGERVRHVTKGYVGHVRGAALDDEGRRCLVCSSGFGGAAYLMPADEAERMRDVEDMIRAAIKDSETMSAEAVVARYAAEIRELLGARR